MRRKGYNVLNPANINAKGNGDAFIRALNLLFKADAIYLLKDWASSNGAFIERHIAIYLNKEVLYED
ncbi:hypothetical protein Epro_0903 [Endomicrobium proavitum]|uniref:DUF4406 domain-containing protein n=1 Tax=Endomicrobium proavitum TaxID=1408281 RepID=A0A0G3WK76_9BACT|nr:hypothetical protein Epro_0903 [Endomicrobium proavitum]